ncbi:phospholipase D-like domain-containing protein [Streptomyces ehimensis]|uniref:phospholipase D n=1 Tax=Streptomyces ehimensis TaxID=68195 RepID=A0ABV9BVC8_9ACTN
MRVRSPAGPVTVQAIAGAYVVLLGMDVRPKAATGLLGFGIRRTDHTQGQVHELTNFRTFQVNKDLPGDRKSSFVDPFQTFLWGDYNAEPEHVYTYEVTAMYGRPGELEPGGTATVQVTTEPGDHGEHAVFFNRGVAASQAYAERFGNRSPADVPRREAYKWLSRGLEEALLRFIGQARGPGTGLRAAVYEFQYERVLRAFRVAADAGADVRIVYDAGPKADGPARKNLAAIRDAGLGDCVVKRTKAQIAHNKFIVLTRGARPEQVWTGSTNITEGGIFGHSNVGHIVRDRTVAASYLRYWSELATDPARASLRGFTDDAFTVPVGLPRRRLSCVYSPRTGLDALEWYVRLAERASSGLFLTAAFGLSEPMTPVFAGHRDYLRYLLLDKYTGAIEVVRRDPGNLVVAGGHIGRGGWRDWVEERLTGLNKHVEYVHTKYMLIDPLGDDPLVITGSANWSDASARANDENILVIRGDTRVADIYLGEFMRVFNHFEIRSRPPGTARAPRGPRGRLFLHDDDSWVRPYFEPGSPKEKERLLFR